MSHDQFLPVRQAGREFGSLFARRLPLLSIGVLLLGSVTQAGDLADVKTRGKLVVVTFPLIEDSFR